MKRKLKISVGVCCHNEEKNIRSLLETLLMQRTEIASIVEIIIVSSSTDGTNAIVRSFELKDKRIKLVIQKKRNGKASAVNQFLKQARGEILVLLSADTIPAETCIENLTAPFLNPEVGMTGGRPIPTNDPGTFMGFTAHFLWNMHHCISELKPLNPKLGEVIAFRNIIKEINTETAVDEAWIEGEVKKKGLYICYVPDAIIYNCGPKTVTDFLKQRRRIYAGHIDLKMRTGFVPPTMDVTTLLRAFPRAFNGGGFKGALFMPFSATLEIYARFLGTIDLYRGKNPCIWEIAESSKEVSIEQPKSDGKHTKI